MNRRNGRGKVALVIPTHFDESSVIAGAERYAYSLAKAIAQRVETTLITFADANTQRRDGALTIRYCRKLGELGSVVNPVCLSFLRFIGQCEVIHCLQFRTLVTELAILYGRLRQKRLFVTDLAGGTKYALSRVIPVWKSIDAFLPISDYNRRATAALPVPAYVIYGGVDAERFVPGEGPQGNRFLYVGRIFPLKGLHHLIAALPPGGCLDVVGRACDQQYLADLKQLSTGKQVTFYDYLSDAEVILKYQQAVATVLPSLVDGGYTTAMESMACGTPVIGTEFGSLPEVVDNERTGFLVTAGHCDELRDKLSYCLSHRDELRQMGMRGRQHVLDRFTWDMAADRCLTAYGLA